MRVSTFATVCLTEYRRTEQGNFFYIFILYELENTVTRYVSIKLESMSCTVDCCATAGQTLGSIQP